MKTLEEWAAILYERSLGPATEHNIALIRLEYAGREWTEHNINCEKFAMALEALGAHDLSDTICYEGSPAWIAANALDERLGIGEHSEQQDIPILDDPA